MCLEEWQQALDFSRQTQQSQRERGAPSLELARTAFGDYAPLIRLNRCDEAGELLRTCRDVFEREGDIRMLGGVFSALADMEHELQHPEMAQHFEETALRYAYAEGYPAGASLGHRNISIYIISSRGEWREALAHRLAAVLIDVATQSGRAASNLAALVHSLRNAGPEGRPGLPEDLAALCATVEKVEGVRFREMIERLVGGPAECNELFRHVVAAALEPADKPE